MMDNTRLQMLRPGSPVPGRRYVLYWMQQAQRTRCNPALEWALSVANACRLPLVVVFALTDAFPEANRRHYAFMLEGLHDVAADLRRRRIAFALLRGNPPDVVIPLGREAALLVGDIGYLRVQRQWRETVASRVDCPFTVVETDVVVPVEQASDKEEYAARTLRPKIQRLLSRYLVPSERVRPNVPPPAAWDRETVIPDVRDLALDHSVPPSTLLRGGQVAAAERLKRFLAGPLARYADARNDPSLDAGSGLSPYLHFGQISPLDIALQVRGSGAPDTAVDAYLEELIVRRELGMNFVRFQPRYDAYEALPEWARRTLDRHRRDSRPYRYAPDVLDAARTHDPYWNAAQREMTTTGRMHNYMRMYWGKKVIEWSPSPELAFETLLALNNRYELDGRDPNGFTGVAWCFGKHDRPWGERPVFGTVRYMAASGLERKFNIAAYARRFSG